MSKQETEVIEKDYKIETKTFIPSVYGESHLKHEEILVSQDEIYFTEISIKIELTAKTNRPVLVYFESKNLFKVF